MTNRSAIALGVAEHSKVRGGKPSPQKPESPFVPPVPPAYVKFLIGVAREIGWNENQLADKAGISYQTLYRARDGQPGASTLSVRKMKKALEAAGREIPPVPVDEETWVSPEDIARMARPKLDPESETIRAHLAEARERVKLDVYEVNARTGIPVATIEAYESGTEMVSAANLRTLAKLYGYKTDDIYESAPLPEPDRAARSAIHMRTDEEIVELLTPAERERLEAHKREALAINEAARKRLEAAKKPKR